MIHSWNQTHKLGKLTLLPELGVFHDVQLFFLQFLFHWVQQVLEKCYVRINNRQGIRVDNVAITEKISGCLGNFTKSTYGVFLKKKWIVFNIISQEKGIEYISSALTWYVFLWETHLTFSHVIQHTGPLNIMWLVMQSPLSSKTKQCVTSCTR